MKELEVEVALQVFSEKWKPIIIYHLIRNGAMRYSELQRAITDINKRILTLRLKET